MALTENLETLRKDGELVSIPVDAATLIYKGAIVAVDPGTGLAVNASAAAAQVVIGTAYEQADNSAGAASAISVRVDVGSSNVYTTATLTEIGEAAYAQDENTVDVLGTGVADNLAGTVVGILSATSVRIVGKKLA